MKLNEHMASGHEPVAQDMALKVCSSERKAVIFWESERLKVVQTTQEDRSVM